MLLHECCSVYSAWSRENVLMSWRCRGQAWRQFFLQALALVHLLMLVIPWSPNLQRTEVNRYEKKRILDNFSSIKNARPEREIHHLLHNDCAPNYAWVLSGNPWRMTQIVVIGTIIPLIMKNIIYRPPPLSGLVQKRCELVDNFDFATNKTVDVCIGIRILFLLGSFLQVIGSISCAWRRH